MAPTPPALLVVVILDELHPSVNEVVPSFVIGRGRLALERSLGALGGAGSDGPCRVFRPEAGANVVADLL